MKCVFIVYNQANTERVEYMLDELGHPGLHVLRTGAGPRQQGRGAPSRDPYLAGDEFGHDDRCG